jgi:hypothetical protein
VYIGPNASPQSSAQPAGSKRPLETLARPRWSAVERGHRLPPPRWPLATLAARSTLAIPTCPRGRRGQGTMLNQFVGQLTARRERVRHRVRIGPNASATILGTAGGQGPLEAALEPLTRRRCVSSLSGEIDCRPSRALRHPCCPICPRHPDLPKGAKGPENDATAPAAVPRPSACARRLSRSAQTAAHAGKTPDRRSTNNTGFRAIARTRPRR